MCYLFFTKSSNKNPLEMIQRKNAFYICYDEKKRNFIYQNAVGFIIQAKIDGK